MDPDPFNQLLLLVDPDPYSGSRYIIKNRKIGWTERQNGGKGWAIFENMMNLHKIYDTFFMRA